MTAVTLAPPLPAPAQPGQITVAAHEPAAEVMYAKLWRTPLGTSTHTGVHHGAAAAAQDRAAATATALYATADPTGRTALLAELADAYRQIGGLLPRSHWAKRVLTGRAVLAQVLAGCEPTGEARVLDSVPLLAGRVADQQSWNALAAATDHLQRAELLQDLYDSALTCGVSGWTASLLLALATTETALASQPPRPAGE
jgi:hypothetical protein